MVNLCADVEWSGFQMHLKTGPFSLVFKSLVPQAPKNAVLVAVGDFSFEIRTLKIPDFECFNFSGV